MNCTSCGTLLPPGANACPNCGTLVPAYHSNAGSSPNGPTVTESSLPTAVSDGLKPATYYGSESAPAPYANAEAPISYSSSYPNPYSTGLPPPPPLVARKRNLGLVIGIILLAVILIISGSIIYVLGHQGSATPQKSAVTQASVMTQTQAQTLFSQTTNTTPAINDPLVGGDNYGWDNYGDGNNTKCWFPDKTLHSMAVKAYFSPCYAKATNFSDFVLQAQMTLIKGNTGGLVFRANSTNDKGYQFRISTDGTCILNRIVLDSGGNIVSDGETLFSHGSPDVQSGANTLSVLVQGHYMYLFVNGKYVGNASDSTYQSGQIGVYVDSDADTVEASFSNVKVWKL